jgi:hypothetical protein
MADIQIDRLSLNLTGSTAPRGETLARKIADGLADASLTPSAQSAIPCLSVNLRGAPGESDEALAGRIVAEILQQLNRIA